MLSLAVYLEIICFVTALICLRKIKNNAWRGMIIYLFITCVAEITGHFLRVAHHKNAWVYNLLLIAEALFNSGLFGSILKQYLKARPLIIGGLVLTFAMYIFELISHGVFIFNDLTVIVMSVIFVVYSLYYYFLLIKDEHYIDLKRHASFWWVTGSLFYYFGGIASYLFYKFLAHINLGGHNIMFTISFALSVLLYSCWIYAFICKRWLQPSSEIEY